MSCPSHGGEEWEVAPAPTGLLVRITVPPNAAPGHPLRINTSGGAVNVPVPQGAVAGQPLQVRLPPGHALV